MQEIKVEISLKTVISFFAILIGLWLVLQIKEVLAILFVSFIIMSAFNPLVEALENKKIPRVFAALSVYSMVVCILVLLLAVVIPALISQIGEFAKSIPYYVEKLLSFLRFLLDTGERHNIIIATQDIVSLMTQNLTNWSGNIFGVTFGFFNGLVLVITTSVFSFYLLLEHRTLKRELINLFPEEVQERIFHLVVKVEQKLGSWLRGQLVLMFFVGLLEWIGLEIIGIDYALSLGIIGGILEIIPVVGPFMTIIPVGIVALVSSPWHAVFAIIWLIIVQQIENNFLVPKIMHKAVGINPLMVLVALLIGGKIFGTVGVILSVPITAAGLIILQDIQEHDKKHT